METVWNKKKYQSFIKELEKLGDKQYKQFTSNLGINKDYLIGVRTLELKT